MRLRHSPLLIWLLVLYTLPDTLHRAAASESDNGVPTARHAQLETSTATEIETATTIALKPYTAEYATTAMGLGMTLKRRLRRTDEGWELRNEGSVFVASLKESAHFRFDGRKIMSQFFRYDLKGIVNRRREVQFDPAQGLIRSLRKDHWSEHPWQPGVLDRLSQQEQLRIDLLAARVPPASLQFSVIDGHRIKQRELILVGEEPLETRAGTLRTVHYRQQRDEDDDDRASDIWLAPDLDYLMVRTVHIDDGNKVVIDLKHTSLLATEKP